MMFGESLTMAIGWVGSASGAGRYDRMPVGRTLVPQVPVILVIICVFLLPGCLSGSPAPTAEPPAASAAAFPDDVAAFPDDAAAATPDPITLDPGLAGLQGEVRNAAVALTSLSEDAFSLLSDPVITETERRDRFRLLFSDGFDLQAIGRFVLGNHWATTGGVQQRQFLRLYEDLIVNSYAERFRDYSAQGFRITGGQEINPTVQQVTSTVATPDGDRVSVDWFLRRTDYEYRVIDVAVGGVSLGRTQRDEYDSVVQRQGLDGLLAVLQQRVAALEE